MRAEVDTSQETLEEIDEALEKLSQKDSTKAELVKLRYFAGLTSDQAARILGMTVRENHTRI